MSARAITALFATTADGHLVAQVEDLAWLADPVEGGVRVLSAWRLSAPIASWKRSDFTSVAAHLADEAGFRAYVEEVAGHRRALRLLDRQDLGARISTPWGWSQQSQAYAEGVVCHATASHGGFRLDAERNALVHPLLRNGDGWYEEDAEWAKVAVTFPALFTAYERKHADQSLRNYEPDAWEAINGAVIPPGESRVKDERQFRLDHACDWVVISANRSTRHPGQIECVASRGGVRGDGPRRQFLVAANDYAPGRFGFVIDEHRHPLLDRSADPPG